MIYLCLTGVHPTSVHLMGGCLMGVYLTGVYLMDVCLLGVYLVARSRQVCIYWLWKYCLSIYSI
jgi:hypothetical protein